MVLSLCLTKSRVFDMWCLKYLDINLITRHKPLNEIPDTTIGKVIWWFFIYNKRSFIWQKKECLVRKL